MSSSTRSESFVSSQPANRLSRLPARSLSVAADRWRRWLTPSFSREWVHNAPISTGCSWGQGHSADNRGNLASPKTSNFPSESNLDSGLNLRFGVDAAVRLCIPGGPVGAGASCIWFGRSSTAPRQGWGALILRAVRHGAEAHASGSVQPLVPLDVPAAALYPTSSAQSKNLVARAAKTPNDRTLKGRARSALTSSSASTTPSRVENCTGIMSRTKAADRFITFQQFTRAYAQAAVIFFPTSW